MFGISIEVILIGAFVCGVISAIIGPNNGWSTGSAFVVGFFLGIFGILLVIFVNPTPSPAAQLREREDAEALHHWNSLQRDIEEERQQRRQVEE